MKSRKTLSVLAAVLWVLYLGMSYDFIRTDSPGGDDTRQLILIAVLAVPVILVAIMAIKLAKHPTTNSEN